jgi:hypothetical protein
MIENKHINTPTVGAFQVNEYGEGIEWAWWSYHRVPGFTDGTLYGVQVALGSGESVTLPANWTVVFW